MEGTGAGAWWYLFFLAEQRGALLVINRWCPLQSKGRAAARVRRINFGGTRWPAPVEVARYHLQALLSCDSKSLERPWDMANLSIRQVDEETLRQLRLRAARHGVSTEEEVRRILRRAVSSPERLGDLAVSMFGATHGVELELSQRTPHEPIEFEP
jgi:antitoxin FitA